MSTVRQPACAGSFYPSSAEDCAAAVAALREQAPRLPAALRATRLYGGLVPHAGWVYSGPTALAVFDALNEAQPKPETLVFYATGHRPDVSAPSIQTEGLWNVAGVEFEIDTELAKEMLTQDANLFVDCARAHEGDHAIEVQLPLVFATLGKIRFVPVAMPQTDRGPQAGEAAAHAAQKLGRKIAAVASVDLTHYGPNFYGFAPKGVGLEAHRWSKEVNDRRFLGRVMALDASAAYAVGTADQSCCGPAAAAAVMAATKALGATQGVLLEHTTSWERGKHGEPEDFVGYAGVVFV